MIDYKKITYITQCPDGYCELEKAQLYQRRINGGSRPQVCRKHGGFVIQRRKICRGCDSEFYLELTGGRGEHYCIKCDPEKPKNKEIPKAMPNLKLNVTAAKKKSLIPIQLRGWSIDIRGDYCRKLYLCRADFKDLPCSECCGYVGIFKGHDPRKSMGA